MAKLTFILQDGQEVEVLLRKEITIGRSEDNEVVVDAPMISARHACVKQAGPGDFEVIDLQSEGGTFVNDERVDKQVLEHGDRLKFGVLHAVFVREIEDLMRSNGDDRGFDWSKADGDGLEKLSAKRLNGKRNEDRESIAEGMEFGMTAAAEKLAACEAELQAKQTRFVEVQAKLLEAEEISRDLVDELQVLETRRDTLMGELRDAHARLEAMQSAFFQAEKGRELHEQRLVILREEIAQAEVLRAEALEKRGVAEVEFGTEQARLNGMREETRVVAERLGVVSEKLRVVSEEERERSTEVARLLAEEERLKVLTAEMGELETAVAQKQQQFAGLNVEFDLKHEEWLGLLNKNEATSVECAELQDRQVDTAARLHAVSVEQEAALTRLEETFLEIEGAVVRLGEVSAGVAGREGEVRAFQGQLVHLQATRDGLQQRVDALVGREEALIEASGKLEVAIEQERGLQRAIAGLVIQRADGEKNLALLTLSVEKLEYEAEHEALKLHDLTEKTSTQQTKLDLMLGQLVKATEGLQSVHDETGRVKQDLEGRKEALEVKLKGLTGEVEVMTTRLNEISARRAEIARQCNELVETEEKLSGVKADLADKQSKKEALEKRVAELSGESEVLMGSVDGLLGRENAAKGRVEILAQRELGLKRSIESLGEQERVDRERFQAIQNLIVEAEREKRGQSEQLEREVLLKQRQLIEIEERLEPLLRWKETIDQRYAQLQALPESSDETKVLWEQLEADKSQMGQVFTQLGGSGATSYNNGPALRGHARQLEAKIRRDEERYATLRRRVEQLETEEDERSERVNGLERRLAVLRVDVARVERENAELEFDNSEEPEDMDVVASKSILSNIIDGARTRLKPMRSASEVGAPR